MHFLIMKTWPRVKGYLFWITTWQDALPDTKCWPMTYTGDKRDSNPVSLAKILMPWPPSSQWLLSISSNIILKTPRETQTLHAGCSKPEPKMFAPLQTLFPGAWDGQNLISWKWSLHLPTNRVWWGSMHAISSYRGNRPTNTHTHTPTDRTNYNTLRRS